MTTDYWPPAKRGGTYNFGRVCLSFRRYIFESLDVWSSYLHIRYISREYGSSSYMKVIGQGQGHRNKKGWKSLLRQCKTSIGNNCGSVKRRATVPRSLRVAWCFRVWRLADWMVWLTATLSVDTWPEMTARN